MSKNIKNINKLVLAFIIPVLVTTVKATNNRNAITGNPGIIVPTTTGTINNNQIVIDERENNEIRINTQYEKNEIKEILDLISTCNSTEYYSQTQKTQKNAMCKIIKNINNKNIPNISCTKLNELKEKLITEEKYSNFIDLISYCRNVKLISKNDEYNLLKILLEHNIIGTIEYFTLDKNNVVSATSVLERFIINLSTNFNDLNRSEVDNQLLKEKFYSRLSTKGDPQFQSFRILKKIANNMLNILNSGEIYENNIPPNILNSDKYTKHRDYFEKIYYYGFKNFCNKRREPDNVLAVYNLNIMYNIIQKCFIKALNRAKLIDEQTWTPLSETIDKQESITKSYNNGINIIKNKNYQQTILDKIFKLPENFSNLQDSYDIYKTKPKYYIEFKKDFLTYLKILGSSSTFPINSQDKKTVNIPARNANILHEKLQHFYKYAGKRNFNNEHFELSKESIGKLQQNDSAVLNPSIVQKSIIQFLTNTKQDTKK